MARPAGLHGCVVTEGTLPAAVAKASPEQDAGQGGVGAPDGGEGVLADDQGDDQDDRVGNAKPDHRADAGEQQRAAGHDDVKQGDEAVVGGWVRIHNAVIFHVNGGGKGRQRPENVERERAAEDGEGQHPAAAVGSGFEEQNAQGQAATVAGPARRA